MGLLVIHEGSELHSKVNQEEMIAARTLTTKAEEVRAPGAKAAVQVADSHTALGR